MKAMVLCAGFGTRLGELTREIPKPMLDVAGRPLLEYILANLARHGFTEVVVNLHFLPEVIRGYFADGSRWGVCLAYSDEPELLGTAGGVKKVEAFFRDEREFLVHYGDIITDQDFSAMLTFHRRQNALATLLVHERAKSNSVVVVDEDSRITNFLERPREEERVGVTSRLVNSGIWLCSQEVLDAIPEGRPADLPRDILPKLIGSRRLFVFPLSGYRCAIDSPERLIEARTAIAAGRCTIPLPST